MPACQTDKNPSGILIEFFEDTHKYVSNINGTEILYVSGTTFLSKFYPQFDPTGVITARCAKKRGITVEKLQAEWKAKGAESCRLGTRCHEVCEDIELGRKLRNTPENVIESKRFDNAIKAATQFRNKLDILGVEKIVFSHTLKIAGTIDLFAKSKTNNNLYYIIDHKTNEKIEQDNKYNKYCLEPITHIADISYMHYALQLNLYEYLLKREGYVPKSAEFKLILNHVTPEFSKLIQLPNLQTEIRDMIIEYILNNK
jgi:hypothetical protein